MVAIEYLRNRAEECRAIADTFRDADLRRQMLIMADLFDNLALQAELIEAEQVELQLARARRVASSHEH